MPPDSVVIFNPFAGRGRANALLPLAASRAGGAVELLPTDGPGHAVRLAAEAARAGCRRVIAAGGDGTVHEVANGLLDGPPHGATLSVFPFGSMNDYAAALGLDRWWRLPAPGPALATALADVGVVRAGGRRRYFVNGMGVGFNGMVTLESRKIRRVRGLALYTLAFLRAGVKHFRQPPLSVTFDATEVEAPTLALSVNLGQREGGFPVTPDAFLTDGLFDVLHVTDLKRWQLFRYLPSLIAGSLPTNQPAIQTRRCASVRIRSSSTPLCIHTDGELFCVPEDGITEVSIELVPGRLRVETCPEFRPNAPTATEMG